MARAEKRGQPLRPGARLADERVGLAGLDEFLDRLADLVGRVVGGARRGHLREGPLVSQSQLVVADVRELHLACVTRACHHDDLSVRMGRRSIIRLNSYVTQSAIQANRALC
jgi:hypothetical protein